MASKELIEKIVCAEWDFLVESMSETIEKDREIFAAMRASQFEAWPDAAAESYSADLEAAKAAGTNPMMDKFTYMVRFTEPEEYAKMAGLAPAVPEEKAAAVCRVSDLMLAEAVRCYEKYPSLGNTERLYSSSDRDEELSVETYQKGELCTMSEKTLALLEEHLRALGTAGGSMTEQVLEKAMLRSGYETLAEADAAARAEKDAVYVEPNFGGCCCCGGDIR